MELFIGVRSVCISCVQTLIECVSLSERRPSATRNGFRTMEKEKNENEKCSYCRSSSDICFGTSTKCCSSHSDLWSSVCYLRRFFHVHYPNPYFIILFHFFFNGIVFAVPFDLCNSFHYIAAQRSDAVSVRSVFAPLLRSYDYSLIV